MISEPSPPAPIVSTPIWAALIASGEMAMLLGRVSLAPSASPSAAGAGAGSAVQRATPKPVTAASIMAPATVPRRRLSLVIRSEEHTSELQSLMRLSYDALCLKKKKIYH